MDILFDILKWASLIAGGVIVGGGVVVATMSWLLNRPVDDDQPGRDARRS